LGANLEVGGTLLLVASVLLFGLASGAVDAVDFLGLATGILVSLSLLAGLFLFPPVIVFLLSTGQWPNFLLGPQANNVWLDLISAVPLVVLFMVPDVLLRKVWKWEDAPPKAKRIVPGWIASVALIFTCLYAVALHFSSANPLTTVSLPGIAIASLFVGVILWPLYKKIAASFWQLGIAKAVKLKDWRQDQGEVRHELQQAIRKAWRNSQMIHGSPVATTTQPTTSQQPDSHPKH